MSLRFVACFGASDQLMQFDAKYLSSVGNLSNAVFRLPECRFIQRIDAGLSTMKVDPVLVIMKSILTADPSAPRLASDEQLLQTAINTIEHIVYARKYTPATARAIVGFSSELVDHVASTPTPNPDVAAVVVHLQVLCLTNLCSSADKAAFLQKSFARLNSHELSAMELQIFFAFTSNFDEVQVRACVGALANDTDGPCVCLGGGGRWAVCLFGWRVRWDGRSGVPCRWRTNKRSRRSIFYWFGH